jgi:hypothetical protein
MLPVLRPLNWRRPGYSDFNIYVHSTPGDGHCLIHALANAFYEPYRSGKLNGKPVTRDQIIRSFRNDMAERLERIDVDTGKTLYETVGNGGLALLGKVDKNYYSLEKLQSLLRSSEYLGPEIIIVFEHLLNFNIYVLDDKTQDVVAKDNYNENRRSVVVYYTHHHYSAVSRRLPHDGKHVSFFRPNDSFINFLNERLETRPKNYAESFAL